MALNSIINVQWVEVRWCWRTLWSSFIFKLFLSKFWCVKIILLHKVQTRGWSMSLKNGVVLHLGQVNFCGVQVLRRQNSPRLESSYYISLWNLSPLIDFLIVSMFTMLDLPHFWSHLYTHRSLQWCQYHGVHDAHLCKMSSNVCRFKIIKQQPSVKMPGL